MSRSSTLRILSVASYCLIPAYFIDSCISIKRLPPLYETDKSQTYKKPLRFKLSEAPPEIRESISSQAVEAPHILRTLPNVSAPKEVKLSYRPWILCNHTSIYFGPSVRKGDLVLYTYDQLKLVDEMLRCPTQPELTLSGRVVGLPSDLIQVQGSDAVEVVPEGSCWIVWDPTVYGIEDQNVQDSNQFGPVCIGLLQTHIVARLFPTFQTF